MSDKVQISSIEITDLGNIRHFRAELGSIAVVCGENAAGKTTVLNCVRTVLEGGSDPDLVRQGCESGEVILTLSTGHVAHKTIRRDGYELVVTSPDGGTIRAAATWLRDLAPAASFDPIGFLESDPKERAAFLLKTLPLTFEADEVNAVLGAPMVSGPVNLQRLNEIRDGRYEDRRKLNVQVREVQGSIQQLRKALPAEDDELLNWGARRDQLASEVAGINGEIQTVTAQIELEAEQKRNEKRTEVAAKIAELEKQISGLCQELAEHLGAINKALNEAVAHHTAELKARQTELSLKLGEARTRSDQQQKLVGIREAIAEREKALNGHVSEEMRLTKILEDIDALKHRKLKELPIEGLDLKLDSHKRPVILIDDIPLDQLNRQQQLYIAIQAVSFASGRLPMMLCEVAELDNAHLREVSEAAKNGGIQLILARWMDNEPLRVMSLAEYEASLKAVVAR